MKHNAAISRNVVISPIYDLFLICLPFWVPLSYYILSDLFYINNSILFFLYLFILGETHFGSTWLFFLFSNNRQWVSSNKYYSLYIPFILIISLIIIGIYSIETVLFIILLFNIFHVSRQNIGIIKLYSFGINNLIFENILVYSMNIICGFTGIFRFIIPLNVIDNNIYYICVACAIITTVFFIIIILLRYKNMNIHYFASVISGTLLFTPLLFTNSIQDAFAMGVGVHYSQYLAIVLPITIRRIISANQDVITKIINNKYLYIKLFTYLFSYSAMMVLFTLSIKYINYIYLIPVMFQLAHFYMDGFIWRFSNVYIRNNVGRYLFA